uniref:Uncharacterized protein n=1 Tax=Tanacetum cinerariifolium TaxID=118510 RepID=A0A699HP23_TANCI|nr:hypothetical protein [Tanacetum cinerariifolium]
MRIDELHKFSDRTLNDVRNALDDRLKGIRMQYLPQTIWRNGDKDRAAAMIQAIEKMLKTRRIMRSLERFIGGRLRWRYLVPAESHIHNHMLIPDYQDIKYQDFRYSDELSNLGSDSAGTDLVTQEGTDLVTQEGTGLVTKAGIDLVTKAGTDLVTQA